MAAAGPLQNLKAEVTCPICLELFQDPVTSECGHSFCRECIARLCQGDGGVACPLCKEKLRKGNLRPNRELRNIVALLKSQPAEEPRRGNMCQMHGKSLLLYCQVDQTPICLVCKKIPGSPRSHGDSCGGGCPGALGNNEKAAGGNRVHLREPAPAGEPGPETPFPACKRGAAQEAEETR